MNSEYCENLMAAHRANWRLFKRLKRFLLHFDVVIYICMEKNTALDNWKIVGRALLFKSVKRCPFSPLKTHKCH